MKRNLKFYFSAALFPSDSTDAQYRIDLKDITVLLRRNHSEHYKVFLQFLSLLISPLIHYYAKISLLIRITLIIKEF